MKQRRYTSILGVAVVMLLGTPVVADAALTSLNELIARLKFCQDAAVKTQYCEGMVKGEEVAIAALASERGTDAQTVGTIAASKTLASCIASAVKSNYCKGMIMGDRTVRVWSKSQRSTVMQLGSNTGSILSVPLDCAGVGCLYIDTNEPSIRALNALPDVMIAPQVAN